MYIFLLRGTGFVLVLLFIAIFDNRMLKKIRVLSDRYKIIQEKFQYHEVEIFMKFQAYTLYVTSYIFLYITLTSYIFLIKQSVVKNTTMCCDLEFIQRFELSSSSGMRDTYFYSTVLELFLYYFIKKFESS